MMRRWKVMMPKTAHWKMETKHLDFSTFIFGNMSFLRAYSVPFLLFFSCSFDVDFNLYSFTNGMAELNMLSMLPDMLFLFIVCMVQCLECKCKLHDIHALRQQMSLCHKVYSMRLKPGFIYLPPLYQLTYCLNNLRVWSTV